jgi:hypothetical protein
MSCLLFILQDNQEIHLLLQQHMAGVEGHGQVQFKPSQAPDNQQPHTLCT